MSTLNKRFAFLPRFRYDGRPTPGDRVELLGEEAHHALRVRRLRPGDELALIDGRGHTARGRVERLTTSGLAVDIEETAEGLGELPQKIVLYQSLIKHRRFEQALTMAVELGISAVIPLISERTVARPNPDRLPEYLARWSRIAWEEAKLCERSVTPPVGAPVDLPIALHCGACTHKVVLVPRRGVPALDRLVQSLHVERGERLALMIGPEGDFTPQELEQAEADDCHFAGLGERLLRSEVAGVTAVVAALIGLGALEEYPAG
jgi:16S rRNA (uracil1498-N3)-methyltransferase